MAGQTKPDRVLRWPEVRPMVGDIGRTTAWRAIRAGTFPAPVQITPNRVGWRESDIQAWLADRAPRSEARA